jgi:hypothetical protein
VAGAVAGAVPGAGFSVATGVLVEIDGHPCILTAEHVLNNPNARFDNSARSSQRLATSVSRRANCPWIEMRYLDWWTTARKTDEWGPDLAFVRLPEPTGFTSELRAKKSFYNLTKDPERRMREALEHKFGFMAVTGYVGEQIETAPPESGFQDVRIIKGYAFLTGPEEYLSERRIRLHCGGL